jgi:hypothetical protein
VKVQLGGLLKFFSIPPFLCFVPAPFPELDLDTRSIVMEETKLFVLIYAFSCCDMF